MSLRTSPAALLFVAALTGALPACSSGGEDVGSGGGGGTGQGGECPSALDCDCPGGFGTKNECGGFECNCPPTCASDDECSEGFCWKYGALCGDSSGYCTTAARQNEVGCTDADPAECGCDGKLYANRCALAEAGVSPSKAPLSDCAVEKVACSDAPGAAECYLATQYCEAFGDAPPQCRDVNSNSGKACDQLTCECISPIYSPERCTCSTNEAGFVDVACQGI